MCACASEKVLCECLCVPSMPHVIELPGAFFPCIAAGKHAVTGRNDEGACARARASVKGTRLCARAPTLKRLMRRSGLVGGFQTSVTLTLMNHTAPGSTCARECEACLSKLLLLFTGVNPEGPSISSKTATHHPDTPRIFY